MAVDNVWLFLINESNYYLRYLTAKYSCLELQNNKNKTKIKQIMVESLK